MKHAVKFPLLVVAGLLAVTVNAHAFEQSDLDKLKATGRCEGCDLNFAYMKQASLKGANLENANLREAEMKETDLSGANLERADLRRAELEKANLKGARLTGAKLRGRTWKKPI